MTDLFVTGGSGFIGSCLIPRLQDSGHTVRALTHASPIRGVTERSGNGALIDVPGDLLDPSSYRDALAASEVVVHLAAVTGKATRAEHRRTNVLGTERLVSEARAARVSRLVFLSSIVAKLSDKKRYPYAEAKAHAEEIVRAGGCPYTIVRPTIVIGPKSPNLEGLRKLACAPVVVAFGDGKVRVQPIYVLDLVEFLLALLDEPTSGSDMLELGGPETLSMQEFLCEIRAVRGRRPAYVLHVPLGLVAGTAWALESLVDPRYLLLTAGQLSVFAHDTTAGPNDLQSSRADRLKSVRQMLELSVEK